MFGVYDHTNNQDVDTLVQTKDRRKTILDFINRVDQKYDSNVKQIFLILDNASIHKSNNKVKETLARHHSRMHLVFLPTIRSPELNLIESDGYGCIDKR